MKVQKICIGENAYNYILIDDDLTPVDQVTKYMKYLTNIGKSLETRHTYCTGLKFFYEYLSDIGKQVEDISIYLLSNYVRWLRYGGMKETGMPIRSERTVNIYMTIAIGYLRNLSLLGVVGDAATTSVFEEVDGRYKHFKDFLYNVSQNKAFSRNRLKLKVPKGKKHPLEKAQISKLVDSTTNVRDRFLLMLLLNTGLRIGETLGLHHEDILQAGDAFKLVVRDRDDNPNQVFAKTGYREVFITREIIDIYDDYCFFLECTIGHVADQVFVKIHGTNKGMPLDKTDVYSLFKRLKAKTGIDVYPHLFRSTYATTAYASTHNIEFVRDTLGHKSVQTTIDSYVFPSQEQRLEEWKQAQKKMEDAEDGK